MTNLQLNQGGGWEDGKCSPIILKCLAHQKFTSPLLYEGGQITWPRRMLHYSHFIFENLIQFHFMDIAVQGEILLLTAKNEVVPHS